MDFTVTFQITRILEHLKAHFTLMSSFLRLFFLVAIIIMSDLIFIISIIIIKTFVDNTEM